MSVDRTTPTAGTVTGTEYGAGVNEEVAALWDQVLTKLGTVVGGNTITAAATPTLTALADGQSFALIPTTNNTTAVTLNIDSLGAKALSRLHWAGH